MRILDAATEHGPGSTQINIQRLGQITRVIEKGAAAKRWLEGMPMTRIFFPSTCPMTSLRFSVVACTCPPSTDSTACEPFMETVRKRAPVAFSSWYAR